MGRRPRKGTFTSTFSNIVDLPQPSAAAREEDKEPLVAAEAADPLYFSNVWNAGHGIVERFSVDLRRFATVPLIVNNITKIYRERFDGMAAPTCRERKRELASIVRFSEWYASEFGRQLRVTADIDSHVINQIVVWQATMESAEAVKAAVVRGFNRFLDEIQVPSHLRVAQPFTTGVPAARDTLSLVDTRKLVNQSKAEVRLIRKRLHEAHALAGHGHDPRRDFGGMSGNWKDPACRAWVIKRLLKRELHSFDKMRFEMGLGTVMRGLEGRPGAEVMRRDGTIERQVGWKGHIRWFIPWADDIVPFIVMIMVRLGWNLTTVARLRTRRWCEPSPLGIDEQGRETHVNIVSVKVRGRDSQYAEGEVVKAPVPKKPSTYPYRLLKFVEYWTAALRKEVHRRIQELQNTDLLSRNEQEELWHLDAIKDDLFLFKTEQRISSLRAESVTTQLDRGLEAFVERCKVKFSWRELRDAPLLFSYEMSGQNLFVVQLLANHADPRTSVQYIRRKRTLARIFEQFRNIFSASLGLIETDEFDVSRLREILKAQGFGASQISNLLNRDTRSRWGNRCAEPTNPPKGFDRGHEVGQVCTEQDCIDGCPHARWFHDSIQHVADNLVSAERRRDRVGMETTIASTLDDRIARCRALLGQWPENEVKAAIDAAIRSIPDDADGFLDAALGAG